MSLPVDINKAINATHRIQFPSSSTSVTVNTGNNEKDVLFVNINGSLQVTGDIRLTNADCAEEFGISSTEDIPEAGTVMVLNEAGELKRSDKEYDKKVVGVASGAGNYKPGIILDRKDQDQNNNRTPIALVGKTYCKVDATFNPIQTGDLLTTSSTPGHAMKATDPLKAFGAVIGKALHSIASGKGLIPILVVSQ